jgi:PAS domain S-box-containing protein
MFRKLFAAMNEGACLHQLVYDQDGRPTDYRILDVNPAYEQITGFKRETVVGALGSEIYLAGAAPFLERYAQVAETGRADHFSIFWPPMAKHFQICVFSPAKGQFATLFADITDTKRKDEELRQNSQHLSITLNAIGDAVVSTDASGRITMMNTIAEQLTGWPFSAAQGRALGDVFLIVNERTRLPLENPVAMVLRAEPGTDRVQPAILIARDGSEYYIDDKAAPISDANGHLAGAVLIFRNVTEKRYAEQHLQESQEELTTIYNNAPVLLMLLDRERRVRKVNVRVAGFAGSPTSDMIGVRGGEALRCIHALDDPEGCGFGPDCGQCTMRLAVMDTLVTGCSHYQVEAGLTFRIDGRDRRLTFLLSTARLILREEPLVLVSIMDITRRKQAEEALRESEERFKMLFSNVPVPYQSLDGEGNFLEVNPAWLDTLGYGREEVIGRNFSEFLLPEWQDHFKTQFPRFKTLGEVMGVEFEMVKKTGETVLVSFTGKVGHDAQAHFQQTHCIFQDITAQRRAQSEMVKLEERLQQAQKMEAIGTLAGGIAHDFNNILFPLVGFAEMLRDDLPPGSPLQDNVNEILHAAFRSRELVQQILAFSRKAERKDKPIRLQSIVKEAIKLLRATIPTTIEIKQQIDGECPLVMADPTHIHQIVMNLATNAFHAMEEKGGVLGIMLEAVALEPDPAASGRLPAGRYVHLCVADTGMGMTREILSRVFDPYFTTKSDGKGTGLGLSVVHGIVASYQGDVRIYSEPGQGTEVHVFLPVVEKKIVKEAPDEVERVRGGTERILLVDDEAAIVRMQQQALARLGYQVTVRTASLEALEAFKANPDGFDLLLTDMTMPNLTGLQLAATVKTIRPDLPVILCTGFSEQLDDAKCKALGISNVLMKPVAAREMADVVRKALDGL